MLTLETGPPVNAPTLAALRSLARHALTSTDGGGGGLSAGVGIAAGSTMADAAAAKHDVLQNPTLVRGRIGDENEASLLVAGRVPAASSTPDGWWTRVQLEMDRRQQAMIRSRLQDRRDELRSERTLEPSAREASTVSPRFHSLRK